jgi:hypothetical protein
MSVKGDKTKCKHPERACKYCFECENEQTEELKMKTINKDELASAACGVQAPLLSANERIILAALILKKGGGMEFDYQAGEILKKAYQHEEARINLNYSYEGC